MTTPADPAASPRMTPARRAAAPSVDRRSRLRPPPPSNAVRPTVSAVSWTSIRAAPASGSSRTARPPASAPCSISSPTGPATAATPSRSSPSWWPRRAPTRRASRTGPGAPWIQGDQSQETPLHWAASSDDVELVDALLDARADVNVPGSIIGGLGPIADAVVFGGRRASRRLVERGARPTSAGGLGLTGRAGAGRVADPDRRHGGDQERLRDRAHRARRRDRGGLPPRQADSDLAARRVHPRAHYGRHRDPRLVLLVRPPDQRRHDGGRD